VQGFRCYDNIAANAKCQRVLVLALCTAWLSIVVKVIGHKHTDGSVVFTRWRQCALHMVHPIDIRVPVSVYRPLDIPACRAMSWAGPFSPSKLSLDVWGSGPHLIHGSLGLGHPSPDTKQYLDRFRGFCRTPIHYCDRPTDRQTDCVTRSVTTDRIYVRIVLRSDLITVITLQLYFDLQFRMSMQSKMDRSSPAF